MPGAGVIYHGRVRGRSFAYADLLASGGNTATTAGTWTQIVGHNPFLVHITMASKAVVQLRGGNGTLTSGSSPVWVAPTGNGFQIGVNATGAPTKTEQYIHVTLPVVYVKAMITTAGGNVTARLFAIEPR